MKATKMIWSMVLFLLIGCTAVTATEEPGETAVPPETDTAIPAESIEMQPEEPIVIGTPETEPSPTEDENKQVSEPVTVDLGAITPESIGGEPVVQPAPGNPSLKDPVIQAMTDLSTRLGVSMEDIQLVSLLEVTWRDGSLGCPEAGMVYTQALVSGQQMILQVSDKEYYYHAGKSGSFEYCADPVPPLESLPINPNQPPPPGQDN